MGIRGWVVAGGIGMGLGCSGLPEIPWDELTPPGEEAAADGPDTAELVAAEDPEGKLSDDARAVREASLVLFLTLTPDFEDWRPFVLDRIAVSGETIEQNYAAVKADFATKPAVDVPVPAEDWQVVTVVFAAYNPTEDWASYAHDVETAVTERKMPLAHVGPGQRSLAITHDGEALETVDLTEWVPEGEMAKGFLFAKKGTKPVWHAADEVDAVMEAADAYFGGEEADEEEEVAAAAPAPAARPAPAPAPVVVPEPEPLPEPAPVAKAPQPRVPLPDLEPDPVVDPKAKAKGGKKK